MSGRGLRRIGWAAGLATVTALACEKTGDCPVQDTAGHDADARDVTKSDSSDLSDVSGLDAQTYDVSGLSACQKCIVPGMCFRFQEIEVTEPSEPEGLPQFLNNLWTPDIQAYRLNIVLCVDEVHPGAVGILTLKVTAGAAWHDLPFAQVLPVEHSNKPSWFQFVQGFTTTFAAEVAADCTFRTMGPADLWFHPGPADRALVCSAGDESIGLPVDTIPIENLVARGSFNDVCTEISGGRLEGCIADAAACQICSFILAPDYREWNKEPDETITNPMPCQSSYCKRHCGSASGNGNLPKCSTIWANFGGFVQGIGVPIACDTDGDGTNDGYKLAGNWVAGRVTYKSP